MGKSAFSVSFSLRNHKNAIKWLEKRYGLTLLDTFSLAELSEIPMAIDGKLGKEMRNKRTNGNVNIIWGAFTVDEARTLSKL